MSKTFGLALGSGGSRGLAHILMCEALDELGCKPVAVAGSSVGALVGAAYCAGMSGKEMRRHVMGLAHDRAEVFRRLIATRGSTFASLLSAGLGSMTLVDAEKFCTQFLPGMVPARFEDLPLPLIVIASDLYRREQVAFSSGPLWPALAASIALPTLMRPVMIDGHVLIDGGATNPLPFEHVRERADVTIAVDISSQPFETRHEIPSPWECMFAAVLVMASAITAEKVKHAPPDLLVRPNVGRFRMLDFLQASAILRAGETAKRELKDKLPVLLQ
ncbi:MAG TPA: patatin-like phospholipase family protein [Xanthobacteraceae bacterium]|jgi:NTE family protein